MSADHILVRCLRSLLDPPTPKALSFRVPLKLLIGFLICVLRHRFCVLSA
jgi:hypothetical protein